MKKIVFLSLFALCLPWALSAQSVDDDLYYVPSKKKEERTEKKKTPAADAVVVRQMLRLRFMRRRAIRPL